MQQEFQEEPKSPILAIKGINPLRPKKEKNMKYEKDRVLGYNMAREIYVDELTEVSGGSNWTAHMSIAHSGSNMGNVDSSNLEGTFDF